MADDKTRLCDTAILLSLQLARTLPPTIAGHLQISLTTTVHLERSSDDFSSSHRYTGNGKTKPERCMGIGGPDWFRRFFNERYKNL